MGDITTPLSNSNSDATPDISSARMSTELGRRNTNGLATTRHRRPWESQKLTPLRSTTRAPAASRERALEQLRRRDVQLTSNEQDASVKSDVQRFVHAGQHPTAFRSRVSEASAVAPRRRSSRAGPGDRLPARSRLGWSYFADRASTSRKRPARARLSQEAGPRPGLTQLLAASSLDLDVVLDGSGRPGSTMRSRCSTSTVLTVDRPSPAAPSTSGKRCRISGSTRPSGQRFEP